MKRRIWTPADDDLLRRCVAEGISRKDTAARLERTESALTSRCRKLGLRFDEALARARAGAAVKQRWQDPAYKQKVKTSLVRSWTPERRQRQSGLACEREMWRNGQKALAEGTEARARQKRAASRAAIENAARRLAWCPPALRTAYVALTRKGLSAREARAAMQGDIAAFARTFEGQMWKLSTGQARLVPNVKIGRPDPAMTSAHGEAMS